MRLRLDFTALIVVVALILMPMIAAPPEAAAGEPVALVAQDSLTTKASTVAASAFVYFDAYAALGLPSDISRSDRSAVRVIIRVLDDATTTSCRARVKCWDVVPTSANLVGTAARTTGIVVEEGTPIVIPLLGRYVGVYGDRGTSTVSIVRRE